VSLHPKESLEIKNYLEPKGIEREQKYESLLALLIQYFEAVKLYIQDAPKVKMAEKLKGEEVRKHMHEVTILTHSFPFL
jgi:hypothetical protein